MALDQSLATSLGIERFLYPPASLKATAAGQEQLLNADGENDPLDGFTVINGTITRATDTQFRDGAAVKFTKTAAAGTSAYVKAILTPPRGLMIPSVRRIVGPFDHVKTAVSVGDTKIAVNNIGRWPESGTASFEHAQRNTDTTKPIEEFSWLGKTGDSLDNVVRNIRNENNLVTIHAGDYVVGTSYINRFLSQVAVLNTNATAEAFLSAHPQYDTGSGFLFASTGVNGPSWKPPLGEWMILELVYDVFENNLMDPSAAPPTRIEFRLTHHLDNVVNAVMYFDEWRTYHMLQLDTLRDADPADTVVDVGEVFERTAGGIIRSARVRALTKRSVVSWGRGNTIPATLKNHLVNWHQDLCYPFGASRSFDFQAIGRADGFIHEQEEVVWVDGAPVFREHGPNGEWSVAIPLEHVTSDTAGIQRAGLK